MVKTRVRIRAMAKIVLKKSSVARLLGPFTRIFWAAVGFTFRTFSKTRATTSPDLNLEKTRDLGPTVVLGRGPSVACFVGASLTYKTVIVANFTSEDFLFPGVSKTIEKSDYLVFMGNQGEYIPSRRSISSLPLVAVVFAALHRSYSHKRKRTIGRLSGLGRKVQSLPPDFSPEVFDSIRNSGLSAVALAALRSKEVHIFGIDFYETGFLSVPDSVGWRGELTQMSRYGSELIDRFEWLIRKFPEVKFHLTTQSSHVNRQYSNLAVSQCNITAIYHRGLQG